MCLWTENGRVLLVVIVCLQDFEGCNEKGVHVILPLFHRGSSVTPATLQCCRCRCCFVTQRLEFGGTMNTSLFCSALIMKECGKSCSPLP